VFENGGYIYRFDLDTDKATKVPVRIHEDQPAARGGLKDVSKSVSDFDVSPDGKRALFGARGEVFTVPTQHSPTRNLTNTSGVHERDSKWSPDGKLIAYIGDATGEDEIYVVAPDGKGKPRQITSGGNVYKYAFDWSPDSTKLLWADRAQHLQYVDVATKQVKAVAAAKAFEIRAYNWSPDSRWVCYVKPEESGKPRLYVHSLEKGDSYPVTDGFYDAASPTFSSDGKYLFFVSNRDFNPLFSQVEWDAAYTDMSRIYLVTLAKATPSPLEPKSDESSEGEKKDGKPSDDKKPADAKKPGDDKKPAEVKIDLEGLGGRVIGLPIGPANYGNLQSAGNTLYYMRTSRREPVSLHSFDLSAKKDTAHGPVLGYQLSADRKKMIVSQPGGKYGVIDLPKGPVTIEKPLDLSGLQMNLDRHAEWRQIFGECWRQMRDFFFNPTLNGVDWTAVRAKYEPLVAHVNHRADLTYVIGEMIGELNSGHAYVGGGDVPEPARIKLGLLGARFERDPRTKFFKIVRILPGENWDKRARSPLTEIGVDVKLGDFITAVNGRPTSELADIYEALVNTADKPVILTVNGEANAGGRDVTVTPIDDEAKLYYHDWVETNRKKVEKATDGRVGYLHVPDMGPAGLNEFAKYFFPQLQKKALIVDVRGNAGGNVSPILIERLRRELVMVDIARNGVPRPDPNDMLVGPKVCLMNEFSASDGDLFPYRFKTLKIGPLIGKRSWGGVVGIRGSLPLVDGGTLNKPEFSRYDVTGKDWIIEGHGVDPDIVVDNDPAKEYAGDDQQLDKAIDVILEKLKADGKNLPPVPPFPKKDR
jgi:tricorn protease